jgi:hypothetical protein
MTDQTNGGRAPPTADVRLSRYKEIEREADSFGRIIGVRRLKPSEQTRIDGMSPELHGHNTLELDVYDDTGKATGEKRKQYISHRAPLILAASVCEVDRAPMPFPRSRAELDATYDMLDSEGLAAASVALARLMMRTELPLEQVKEIAKNSPATPSLDSNAGSSATVSH